MSKRSKEFKVTFLTKTALVINATYSLIAIIFSLFVSLSYNYTNKTLFLDKLPEFLHLFKENILFYLEKGGISYFIIYSLICTLIIIGCIIMFRGKRIGFSYFFYGEILAIILPLLFFNKRGIGLGDIMLSVLFIVFYFIQINIHKIKSSELSNEESEKIENSEEIEDLLG